MMKSNNYPEVDAYADGLADRIAAQTETCLSEQLEALGVSVFDVESVANKCQREFYPDDPYTLAAYKYEGQLLLVVKISENKIGIEFVTPKLKPRNPEKRGST